MKVHHRWPLRPLGFNHADIDDCPEYEGKDAEAIAAFDAHIESHRADRRGRMSECSVAQTLFARLPEAERITIG
jgi:hypothetical protein